MEQLDIPMKYWRDAKFEVFIHWVVYAVSACFYRGNNDYKEWIMYNVKIPVKKYQGFAKQFNPVKYDPNAWVKITKEWGMHYIKTSRWICPLLFKSKCMKRCICNTLWQGITRSIGGCIKETRSKNMLLLFTFQDWNNPGDGKKRDKEGEGLNAEQLGDFDNYLEKVALPQVK
jgi:alpha-L-fucosidase